MKKKDEAPKVVIQEIYDPYSDHLADHKSPVESNFPGIFSDRLLKSSISNDDKIILNSQWGTRTVLLEINIETRAIKNISAEIRESLRGIFDDIGSFVFLDLFNSFILVQISSPNLPPIIIIYDLDQKKTISMLEKPCFQTVKFESHAPKTDQTLGISESTFTYDDLRWSIFPLKANDGIYFESMLLYSKKSFSTLKDNESSINGLLPLIVVPHGGPHSITPSSYIASYAFLANHTDAALLFVNYRGSTGYGQKSIESLPGKIGINDISDIMQAVDHAKALKINLKNLEIYVSTESCASKLINNDRIGVVGGSHGGFISCHLIGQYPDIFKVSCARNPVTNIPAMASVTDIPDWCFVEGVGIDRYDFEQYSAFNSEDLNLMLKCSPVFHIDKVKSPTLICLGAKDRRVPFSQGIEFYHLLKSRKIPTELIVFPEDVHAIDKPASEAEHWIAIADWFDKYL